MGQDYEEILKKSLMFDMFVEMVLKKATLSSYDDNNLNFHNIDAICEMVIPSELYEARIKKLKGE